MTIINPWKSPHYGSGRDYEVNKPVFSYNNHHIYHLYGSNYLYTKGNLAFNELNGLNKDHLKSVANLNGSGFLYDRALETLKKQED
jgi:hypothetical protein